MAKKTAGVSISTYKPTKTTRPGVHAKTKTAKNKHSKNYVKPYRGQGR